MYLFIYFVAAVVGMLKSLHQLQEENRRLEEQIKTLTMKKERLQLLSAQLSVPFTPSTASSGKRTAKQIWLVVAPLVRCVMLPPNFRGGESICSLYSSKIVTLFTLTGVFVLYARTDYY